MSSSNHRSPRCREPFLIAEMACSHEGDPEIAKTIIDGAIAADADAVQFQIWELEGMMVPDHPDFETVLALQMSADQWTGLFEYAKKGKPGMEVIACVYEEKSIDLGVEMGVDSFKLHAADLNNPILLEKLGSVGRRIDLSVGASTIAEISSALAAIERGDPNCEVWLMYGYQLFPTPPEGLHLGYLQTLQELFQRPVGYQDHSDPESLASSSLSAAALGNGCSILEKHITHDRSKKGADHAAALNPDEFLAYAEMVREVATALGDTRPRPFSEAEEEYRAYCKKSFVAARDLEAGTVLALSDLAAKRTRDLGIFPDRAEEVVGRKLSRALAADEPLAFTDLTDQSS